MSKQKQKGQKCTPTILTMLSKLKPPVRIKYRRVIPVTEDDVCNRSSEDVKEYVFLDFELEHNSLKCYYDLGKWSYVTFDENTYILDVKEVDNKELQELLDKKAKSIHDEFNYNLQETIEHITHLHTLARSMGVKVKGMYGLLKLAKYLNNKGWQGEAKRIKRYKATITKLETKLRYYNNVGKAFHNYIMSIVNKLLKKQNGE